MNLMALIVIFMRLRKNKECLKCGQCCYLAFFDREGNIVRTSIKCPYLTKDNLCSIYDHRPNWCMTAKQMAELGVLPERCGYLIKEIE